MTQDEATAALHASLLLMVEATGDTPYCLLTRLQAACGELHLQAINVPFMMRVTLGAELYDENTWATYDLPIPLREEWWPVLLEMQYCGLFRQSLTAAEAEHKAQRELTQNWWPGWCAYRRRVAAELGITIETREVPTTT